MPESGVDPLEGKISAVVWEESARRSLRSNDDSAENNNEGYSKMNQSNGKNMALLMPNLTICEFFIQLPSFLEPITFTVVCKTKK